MFMNPRPRAAELAAILVADVIGYSRLADGYNYRGLTRCAQLAVASSPQPSRCITGVSSNAPATAGSSS